MSTYKQRLVGIQREKSMKGQSEQRVGMGVRGGEREREKEIEYAASIRRDRETDTE